MDNIFSSASFLFIPFLIPMVYALFVSSKILQFSKSEKLFALATLAVIILISLFKSSKNGVPR